MQNLKILFLLRLQKLRTGQQHFNYMHKESSLINFLSKTFIEAKDFKNCGIQSSECSTVGTVCAIPAEF